MTTSGTYCIRPRRGCHAAGPCVVMCWLRNGFLYGKLPQTTTEEALKCFEKAIEINPNRLMHYVELGRAYAQIGRTAEARRFIEKGLAIPNVEKDDPETKHRGQGDAGKTSLNHRPAR